MRARKIDMQELVQYVRLNDGVLERYDDRMHKWRIPKLKMQPNQYAHINIAGKSYAYHRILFILHIGKDIPEGMQVDHINGDKADNRIENLRIVTARQNNQNRDKHRAGNAVGVAYRKNHGTFVARIHIGHERIHLGYYPTETEASIVYNTACEHIMEYVNRRQFVALLKEYVFISVDNHYKYNSCGYAHTTDGKYRPIIYIAPRQCELGICTTEEEAETIIALARKHIGKYENNVQYRAFIKKLYNDEYAKEGM